MKKLLIKEFRLAASPLSFVFTAAALMTMLPGYPILMSAFFICLGLFYSFLNAREFTEKTRIHQPSWRLISYICERRIFSCKLFAIEARKLLL